MSRRVCQLPTPALRFYPSWKRARGQDSAQDLPPLSTSMRTAAQSWTLNPALCIWG